MIRGQLDRLSKLNRRAPMIRNSAREAVVLVPSGFGTQTQPVGKYNDAKENKMSHNKTLRVRGVLTLGAAAFALCVGAGSVMAAGHEGRAAGMAAGRGGSG